MPTCRARPLLRTVGDGHTPFNLDTYDGDVGMAYIAGPIGSGKSTLLATMVLQWLKYPGAEVRIFDTGQSLRCATYAVGGHWYDVAAELEHQTQPRPAPGRSGRANSGGRPGCRRRSAGNASSWATC